MRDHHQMPGGDAGFSGPRPPPVGPGAGRQSYLMSLVKGLPAMELPLRVMTMVSLPFLVGV